MGGRGLKSLEQTYEETEIKSAVEPLNNNDRSTYEVSVQVSEAMYREEEGIHIH